VALEGEVDLDNVAKARALIVPHVESGGALVLDLESLCYIDSVGLHLLDELSPLAAERDCTFRVSAPLDSIAGRVLSLAVFDRLFPIDSARSQAIEQARRLREPGAGRGPTPGR
jgi:anti-anti-sigma factor